MMQREIKFRGLCSRRLIWVYGYLSNKDVINTEQGRLKVIPETVGQFTGLTDKNGTEIYEGDIVNVPYNNIGNVTVRYSDEEARYNINRYSLKTLAVIGNIHEQKSK